MNAHRLLRASLLRGAATLLPLSLIASCAVAIAGEPLKEPGFWQILDTHQTGASAFLRAHPTWDGRGAVVAVLDTGVDMSVAGLTKTSTGKPKVIVARDFSGEGAVTLSPATIETIDGVQFLSTDEGKVRGFDQLAVQPATPDGWMVGFLLEEHLKNSEVPDINLDGSTSGRFAVVTVPTKGGDRFVAYVDLDGDSDLTGATPRESFERAPVPFSFNLRDPQNQRPPAAFALHIDEDGAQVEFHWDDGGHGTHVAGIATGYGLMGRKGYNGIAPGAQVMSLKIGDNTLAGGATTTDSMQRAIEFAGEWSKSHKTPVIINLSYGIGSEIEGESDIDLALDAALAKYPLLHASVSAGNEGPGLSSVGTPAGSHLATTVAAMLPRATAEALFGAKIGRDGVFAFSSRGGELAKPDLLAPGVASSSVPAHDHGDIKGGTSMAAPQISGFYAALASAAVATHTRFNGNTLKRAAKASAKALPGYLLVDQGAGVPQLGRAFELLKAMASHREPFEVTGYRVQTEVPTSASGKGGAAYWRAGTYLPPASKGHAFDIEAELPEDWSAKQRAGFQTLLRFKSEQRWLSVDRKQGRLLAREALSVLVSYNSKALTAPGVYSGRVLATPDDGGGVPAFSLWSTIVVPHTFGGSAGYVLRRSGRLEPLQIRRIPLLVPPAASHMNISVETPRGKFGNTALYLFDPAGRAWPISQWRASTERHSKASVAVKGGDLKPGIWEVVLYSSFSNKAATHWDLSVRFHGIDAEPMTHLNSTPGKAPSGQISVTNRYDTRFRGEVSGSVFGWRKTQTHDVVDDTLLESFDMNDEVQRVELVLKLDPKTYNRFTDVAVTIMDDEENALVKSGFSNGIARVSVPKSEGVTHYTLEVKGAMAHYDEASWPLEIEQTFVWAKPVHAAVDGPVVLFPQVETELTVTLDRTPPTAPKGYVNYGELRFMDQRSNDPWLTLPMSL